MCGDSKFIRTKKEVLHLQHLVDKGCFLTSLIRKVELAGDAQ